VLEEFGIDAVVRRYHGLYEELARPSAVSRTSTAEPVPRPIPIT
jgi:hypothetical protein